MKVDGQGTGVKLDLDLNFLLKTGAAALLIWYGGLQWSVNDKMNTMATQISIIQVKLEQSEKANANFVTLDQINARGKLRDLQLSTIESRINALETKVGMIGSQPTHSKGSAE
ncbi:hypothetical protein MOR12E_28825 [Methylobacterium oryzae]